MRAHRHRYLAVIQCSATLVFIAIAVLTTHGAKAQSLWLAGGLFAFGMVSQSLALELRGVQLTGAFAAVLLGAILLGPAPGIAIGLLMMCVNAVQRRREFRYVISNLFTWTVFPLVAGVVYQVAEPHLSSDATRSLVVFGLYVLCNALNFLCIWGYLVAADGQTWRHGFTDVFLKIFPVDLSAGILVVGVVYVDFHLGEGAIALVSFVVLLFQYMLRTSLQAVERGEQLEERNRQLAALQFGLISTTMKTLALRDHMTARHSAAVARYAREMARELGLSTEEQELFHTAGLFHDIGKFIFPDSILFAGKGGLSDDEYAIVRRHPEVGADLIAEIEGYGPVARIVRHHHERIDGRGYPFGLMGDDIPLGSKIIAVADVYDVLTARDTYRQPVSSADAFAELRASAGTQLDAELVEVFISLVTRRGVVFSHSSADDFEAELALERRVSDYARPRLVA